MSDGALWGKSCLSFPFLLSGQLAVELLAFPAKCKRGCGRVAQSLGLLSLLEASSASGGECGGAVSTYSSHSNMYLAPSFPEPPDMAGPPEFHADGARNATCKQGH